MTLEDHAQKVLRALGYSKLGAEANSPAILAALRALEAEVYNRAIEDAAKVAEKIAQCSNATGRADCCEATGEDIAEEIRALAKTEGPNG